jgi:hypothetical protein
MIYWVVAKVMRDSNFSLKNEIEKFYKLDHSVEWTKLADTCFGVFLLGLEKNFKKLIKECRVLTIFLKLEENGSEELN